MLTELRIENFAIIPSLNLEFSQGLITFTGETGAGKSIILDALETVLGGRVESIVIRTGAERASVEATFRLDGAVLPAVKAILEREDLLDDPAYVVLGRDIRREGRNTARINGRAVSVSLLREVGALLVDIHGQSEHLSLLNVHQHIHLLDRYADLQQALGAYTAEYHTLQRLRVELAEIRRAEKESSRRVELLNFQVQEIDSAALKPDEEDTLRSERTRLANAEALAALSAEALAVLEEGTPEAPAVSDLLGQLSHTLGSLAKIDQAQNSLHDQVETMLDTLLELSRSLRDYTERIEFNPRRLEEIEERLDLIYNLKRKYGGSIESILAFAADARRQLDTIEHAAERIAALEAEEQTLLQSLGRQAAALSERRSAAAIKMGKAVERELADLRMEGARFVVDLQSRADPHGLILPDGRRVSFDATGMDRVEFLIAPNPGEGLKPLVKIASGGETSRLMLALKHVLAQADSIPSLVFDEIDQGIGGRVGAVVGQKLWNLARHHQVFCVTHLPQLAAYGDIHLRVTKDVSGGRTSTRVEKLEGEQRRQEIAQMIGGISDGTLKSADELLKWQS